MLRGTFVFITAAMSVVLLVLCEPAFAASNAERLPLIAVLAACFRSHRWFKTFLEGRRRGEHDR
jgi:hypothetical protein